MANAEIHPSAFGLEVSVGLKKVVAICLLPASGGIASEQDQLVTTDFVLNAGVSQSRAVEIRKPAGLDSLVMVGFNPVSTLSIACTLRLYDSANLLLGTYNCAKLQNHFLKTPVPVASKIRAEIEVTNSNFSVATSFFSVVSRFKFRSSAD